MQKGKKLKLLCGTPVRGSVHSHGACNSQLWNQSQAYVAPEIVENKPYSGTAVDVWSLGVLLYIMVAGKAPFRGKTHNDMLRSILKGKFIMPAEFSSDLQDLVRSSWLDLVV